MTSRNSMRRARLGTAFAALAIGLGTIAAPAPAFAQSMSARPSETVNLSAGTGTLECIRQQREERGAEQGARRKADQMRQDAAARPIGYEQEEARAQDAEQTA